MGLSVVHGIAKTSGGGIQVISEPGKGTEFKVYFPLHPEAPVQRDAQIDDPLQGGSERILLVDDEEVVVLVEKQMLERLGYEVLIHTRSLEAMETIRAQPGRFDLVITDMTMPNMSGVQLAAEITKLRPDIPILLCTGYSDHTTEAKAMAMGFKGVLMKPIIMKHLSKKVREVLDGG
jgi:CheY-like chemotaxis protein